MLTHAVFTDLLLHSDDELAVLLGADLVERRTIHEWPLSCVQRIVLEDGRTLVYKSQRPPTVELPFYERADSSLLPTHRALGRLGDCDTMTMEWIDAPLLSTIATRDIDMADHGRRVMAAIAAIRPIDRERHGEGEGALPVYLDVGSREKWSANAHTALDKMRALVLDRRFASLTLDQIAALTTWSASAAVLDAIEANPRVTHGDLKGDQVFVMPAAADARTDTDARSDADANAGYRVIDWQRPVIAPPETDLVSLLVEQHMQPYGFVDITIIRIFWFLRLCWAIEAQFDLFPDFSGGPFERWARRATRHIVA